MSAVRLPVGARFTLVSILLAVPVLAGCTVRRAVAIDAVAVIGSVVEAVENAPAVAEAQGGWPASDFPGGSVRATDAVRGDGVLEYMLEVRLLSRDACVAVARSAVRDSVRFVLDGGTYLTEELPSSSKRRRKALHRMCSAAEYPTMLQVSRTAAAAPSGAN